MNVLLDTAAWINGVKEPETLPAKALAILRTETNRFFLSDISLLEASALGRKGRVDFARPMAGKGVGGELTGLADFPPHRCN